jgi:pimeloyl-ACP methyl ester carboxylesterase
VDTVRIDGITLEYEAAGQGEPVVFIHGSFIADAFSPILDDPRLSGRFQLITYHRRGYAGSSAPSGVWSIADQAGDCRALLRSLGIQRAHVVGHSFGGVVALDLALSAPDLVATLALLEPALAVGASGPGYRQALTASCQRFREAGASVAMHETLRARWPEYDDHLEMILPGAFGRALLDAENVFERELPGLLDWSFGEEQASRIVQPVLSVLGSRSEALWPRFGETHRALCDWLLDAEEFVLPDSTHFLQMEKPREMADALASFLERHPFDPR